MIKKIIFGLLALIALTAVVFLLFHTITCKQQSKIAGLENKISLLKSEQIPLRFKITERTTENFKVAVKFYDANGDVVKRIEKTYPGTELSIDFIAFPIKDRHVAFPFKMYSDKIAPDNGDLLYAHYDKDGFPEIFNHKKIDPELKKGLSALFEKIQEEDFQPEDIYFGNMVHDLDGIKVYKEGVVYKIIVHTKGGIEVVEE